ncbi:MAG: hypothetical protein ACRYGA_06710 [Janthinobacterium lividum]
MKNEESGRKIKWHDRKLLFRSFAIGLIFFALFWGIAKHAEPPTGYTFERLPPINGTYKCCEAGGRYSKSWVSNIGIDCGPISYFEFLGTNRNDCGLKEQLNGNSVTVIRAITPSFGDRSPLVVNISSAGKNYYAISDEHLRKLWIQGSFSGAFGCSFIVSIIFYFIQFLIFERKSKQPNKEKT